MGKTGELPPFNSVGDFVIILTEKISDGSVIMPYKFCPNCFSSSYSPVDYKIWLCPYCGKDIAFMPSTDEVCDLRMVESSYDRPKPYRLHRVK